MDEGSGAGSFNNFIYDALFIQEISKCSTGLKHNTQVELKQVNGNVSLLLQVYF